MLKHFHRKLLAFHDLKIISNSAESLNNNIEITANIPRKHLTTLSEINTTDYAAAVSCSLPANATITMTITIQLGLVGG